MSYAPIRSESTLHTITDVSTPISSKKTFRRSPRIGSRKKVRQQNGDENLSFPIIVHCHLCWDWVWQRPQQFLSRLSRRHRILFIETIGPDAELAAPLARFKTVPEFPNITLLRLQFPDWQWNKPEFVDAERRRMLREFIAGRFPGQFENPVQWFYDPMAVTAFAGQMNESLTVYDCMDELSKFRFAPAEIHHREAELLARADVVFTGGRRLYESKSRFHDNCHFYGCGVDEEHFGKARETATEIPPDLAKLRKPVLGYFGVIDERIDYGLLAHLADANPNWSVAMVGPVLKVEAAALPQRRNLHWLGQRRYEDLPAICKGFDVCLMPFALNEATEYINPTKTLEYMATARPIVSTAVYDVVRNFGSVVKVANSTGDFIALCEEAFDRPDAAAVESGLQMVRDNSWDSIVAKLEGHMRDALARKQSTVTIA